MSSEPRARKLLLPPIVWLACLLAIYLTHELLPVAHAAPSTWRTALGLVLIVAALTLTAWHKRLFRHVGTNVDTFRDPDRLVEDGLFRYVRNPMYLGFVVSLAALAFVSGALTPWLVVLGFFLVADHWYVPFEERALLARFGPRYLEYRARTRRWI